MRKPEFEKPELGVVYEFVEFIGSTEDVEGHEIFVPTGIRVLDIDGNEHLFPIESNRPFELQRGNKVKFRIAEINQSKNRNIYRLLILEKAYPIDVVRHRKEVGI